MTPEPFAYGIQAPIGSVTPLFHKRKDAEDYIAKLTDSRDEARIIPLYRAVPATPTMDTVFSFMNKLAARSWELEFEVLQLQQAIRRLAEQDATLSLLCKRDGSQVVTVTMDAMLTDAEREAVESCIADDEAATAYTRAATLRGLLERLGGKECTS